MNRPRYVRKDPTTRPKMMKFQKILSKSYKKKWNKSAKTVSCGSNTVAWITSSLMNAFYTKFRKKWRMS